MWKTEFTALGAARHLFGAPEKAALCFVREGLLFMQQVSFFPRFSYRKVPKTMNPARSTSQLSLDFTPGLTERHDTLLDCLRACAYSSAKPLKTIAADMDMSSSDLSRKLSANPDDPRRFTVGDLEKYVESTGDTTPILYLAQKYCADNEMKQREALSALAGMAPQLQALLKAAGVQA